MRLGTNTAAAELLATSEDELYELQRKAGFDWYWKAYFALTRLA
jgi:hypothetical protein